MARIAGVNIPTNKHVGIALTHIFGIGRNRAIVVCKAADINPSTVVKDLTEAEVTEMQSRMVTAVTQGCGGQLRERS